MPSVVVRPARLPACAIPRSRRSVRAASRSPSVSTSARLQSIIPAPVRSRSSLTSAAGISVTGTPPRPRERATPRPRRRLLGALLRGRLLGTRLLGGGRRLAGLLLGGGCRHLLGGHLRLAGLD